MFALLVIAQFAWFFACLFGTYRFGKWWKNRKKALDNKARL